MTEGQIPAETCDLPTETVSLYDWQTSGEPLALLAEIPEEEMALYGVADGDAPHVLFRWSGTLAEFPDWAIDTPKSVTPELLALDLNGDGAPEPVVLCYQGGTQVNLYDLHVLRQSNGALTDFRLPDALYAEQLSALLTLGGRRWRRLTVSLGDRSIEAALPDGVQAEALDPPVDRGECLLSGGCGDPPARGQAGPAAGGCRRQGRDRLCGGSEHGSLRPGLLFGRTVHPFRVCSAIQTFLSFHTRSDMRWKKALPSPMSMGTTCM